jgi:DNA-binding transcriptional MerR regulator
MPSLIVPPRHIIEDRAFPVDLTAKQLAEHICHGADAAQLPMVLERVRHWARSGILQPIDRRPGKGKSRLFDKDALIDAAVLNALAGIAGIPILGQKILLALAKVRPEAERWLKGDRRQCWLELVWVSSKSFSAECVPYLHWGEIVPTAGAHAAIILNLSTIFASVRWDASADEVRPSRKRASRRSKR